MSDTIEENQDANNKTKPMNELLKYPILIVSVVLAIIILDNLGYSVTSFGSGGIGLEKNAETSVELSTKLDSLELVVANLSKLVAQGSPGGSEEAEITLEDKFEFQASDLTTKIKQNLRNLKGEDSRKTGWIWIGDYDSTTAKWSKIAIKTIGSEEKYSASPELIKRGETYEVMGNMYVREKLPPNTVSYYRSVKSVGIAPKGTEIEVVQQPTGIKRNHATQYWLKIEMDL